MISDNICITIIDIQRDKVRIGIEADKNIPIHREEVWLRIQEEKKNGLKG